MRDDEVEEVGEDEAYGLKELKAERDKNEDGK